MSLQIVEDLDLRDVDSEILICFPSAAERIIICMIKKLKGLLINWIYL